MFFCFEPMLVREEFGTACWKDIWRVTADGAENLNTCQIRWWLGNASAAEAVPAIR
jgi:hypothetical protein